MNLNPIVESLHEHGYAQTSLADLFGQPYPEAVTQLLHDVEQFASSDKVRQAEEHFRRGEYREGELKQFLVKLRDKRQREGGQIQGDAVGLFGKETQIIQPVAWALRPRTVYYIMSDIWYVIPENDTRERTWSQNWHRDPESQHIVKVMVYFRDVDDSSGPLEFVRGSHRGTYLNLVPQQSYPTADVDPLIDPADKVRFCVPAGTVLFVNTAGLHRGGYTRTNPRISGVWTYVA